MPVSYNDIIKAPGVKIEYSENMVKELIKCSQNFFYFLQFVKIVHPDKGRISFVPRKFQKDIYELILNRRFVCAMVARQSGKSVMISVYCLWYAIFHSDKTVGIVSNKAKSAYNILNMIKLVYEELDFHLKPGVTGYGASYITFENGSKIICSATSPTSLRGSTINLLVADEFAFVSNNLCKAFWTSNYPTISASEESKIIIISTPNGMFNLFHQLYTGAQNKTNPFVHYFADWRCVPGRDEKWKEEQINAIGSIQLFNQEYGCEFLGSTNTLIDSNKLEKLMESIKEPKLIDLNGSFKIYEKPDKDFEYVIGTDVAKGTGKHYSVCQVLKIESLEPVKFKQVATYRSNTIDTYSFAEIVNRISIFYNNAYIMVENNAEGAAIVNELWWNFENMNLVNFQQKGKNNKKELGVRSTKSTKPVAALLMKRLIEFNNLELIDKDTIEELASFIEDNGKFYGKDVDDDTITSLMWACFILETNVLSGEAKLGNNKPSENEIWGILSDFESSSEDFSWLNN